MQEADIETLLAIIVSYLSTRAPFGACKQLLGHTAHALHCRHIFNGRLARCGIELQECFDGDMVNCLLASVKQRFFSRRFSLIDLRNFV